MYVLPVIRDEDADAVGEGEAAVHRLGRLRLAVLERDASHRPGAVARADALGVDHDADVGVVDRAVGADTEPERRAGRERLRAERLARRRRQDRAHERAVGVVLAITPLITLDT